MLDEQSGERMHGAGVARGPGHAQMKDSYNATSYELGPLTASHRFGDTGGASRFFYTAKASRAEREAGLDGDQNVHPTVKPIDLMRWLVRLVTPPGGTVLDPFTGSGTTGCSAIVEGFEFVGCEMSEEYAEIARGRMRYAATRPVGGSYLQDTKPPPVDPRQGKLF